MATDDDSPPPRAAPPEDSADDFIRQLAKTPAAEARAAELARQRLTLRPGVLIARRYRLEERLGEGGMGTVWSAVHTITNARVALKFLKTAAEPDDPLRKRFLREARAASAVKHPNVVEILDVLELDDEAPVIVMDLLIGETLARRLLREHRLDVATTATLLLPVARAMAAAHDLGIVHRDLKPDNIFLAEGPSGISVKVLDFGIAKLLARDSANADDATSTGTLIGTPAYMALEQALGAADLDARADVWALGLVLYECLAGDRAVKASNAGQVVLQLTGVGIRPLLEVAPDLPLDITRVISRMLETDRARRAGTLTDLIAVLSSHAGRDQGNAAPSPPGGGRSAWRGSRFLGAVAISAAGVAIGVAGTQLRPFAARFEATAVREAPGREAERRPIPPSSLGPALATAVASRSDLPSIASAAPEPSATGSARAGPVKHARARADDGARVEDRSLDTGPGRLRKSVFDGGLIEKAPF